MADTIRSRDNVAALHLGELDKLQKENSYSHKAPITTTMNMPAPPLVSPSLYSGPPPPYSYPSSTASSVVGVPNGLVSPPSTRRTSDEDKELPAPARQALPSIHEALGQEQKITVSSMLSNTTAPPSLSHMLTSTSPVVPNSRYPDHTPTKPLPPLSQSQSAPSYYQSIQDQPRHYSPRLPVDLGLSRPPPIITQPQPRPISSPTTASRLNGPYTSHPSPPYERLQSAHSQTMYSPSQPNMQYTSQPPITTYPIPSMPYPAWRNPPDVDRAQVAMQTAPKASPTGAAYGATVKRQLDIFDLELSLNEIAKGAETASRFSEKYRYLAQQAHRSANGPALDSMPSISECDEQIKHQEQVLTSMQHIKEVIVNQQKALQEQRTRASDSWKTNGANGMAGDEFSEDGDGEKGDGGFAGGDSKKRRGRAAPPGRCHSCNRAETPEWRRGPDGARTLCNACGLHYAKLTRKMGSKAAASTGSNLRPKDLASVGSPTQ